MRSAMSNLFLSAKSESLEQSKLDVECTKLL